MHLADAAALAPTDDSVNALVSAATDASSAVGDVTEEAVKSDGWWKQYLNLYKSGLLTIHSTIDEPLRNAGVTQTWGISIAIFTACK